MPDYFFSTFVIITTLMISMVGFADPDIPVCLPFCENNQICARKENQKPPVCETPPLIAPIKELGLPFSSNVEVYCTHSAGSGSHSWTNTFFALDLANSYEEPAVSILASADGKAFVFQGDDGKPCPEPPGTPAHAQTDTCGLAWGNHVKILHEGGYYSFYVHLDKILVQNGSMVKKGQSIGTEGWTGAAGHRHLHWSVQKLPGSTQAEWEKRIAWAGVSVPFQFRAIVDGKEMIVDSSTFKCAHAQIGKVPHSQQPKLRAVNY